MSILTKERLQQLADENTICKVSWDERIAMARQLLAGMAQEPVAYMHHSGQVVTREECCDDKTFAICCKVETPLYAAPQLPQPAVQNMHHDAKCDLFRPQVVNGVFVPRHCDCSAATLQGNHRDLSHPVDPQVAAYEKIMQQAVPDGLVAVPVEPTENMIIAGFEAELREEFHDPESWKTVQAMSGCEQAAHRAKLCWAAMIAAAPKQEDPQTKK